MPAQAATRLELEFLRGAQKPVRYAQGRGPVGFPRETPRGGTGRTALSWSVTRSFPAQSQ